MYSLCQKGPQEHRGAAPLTRVRDKQPLIARTIIVGLLKVETLIIKEHLPMVRLPLPPNSLLHGGHLAAGQLADGAPGLVGVHVELAADDHDAAGQHVVLGEERAEEGVAEVCPVRDVRPVDHGRHGEHVVRLAGAEAAHPGLVSPESALLVVRHGEVAGRVEGED